MEEKKFYKKDWFICLVGGSVLLLIFLIFSPTVGMSEEEMIEKKNFCEKELGVKAVYIISDNGTQERVICEPFNK